MKFISYVLMIVGVGFLAFGGYQWYMTTSAQSEAASEAQALIAERNAISAEDDFDPLEAAKNFNPEMGETAGILHIPKLEADLPIIEGTHEDELERGVGHYQGTAYPLQNEQIVLSGHRDTVFREMGELEIGDHLVVQMEYGDFTYEITETKIVSADDRTIIVPHHEEVLTLTTCYPFNFIGYAPDRYIIYAYPVENQDD
ncbi:class D sortase [Oceanobacillus luteolus]|uniref:Class D sortase n=1 Tax=Oceanobacillus luteolus TaxID=1274358 RepID=A0ABW4HNY8_9BACI|nr:class D sortase [Oceanobacillus luteolus]MCM3740248.1 class D sortase [Oceanobacillus luteolus]